MTSGGPLRSDTDFCSCFTTLGRFARFRPAILSFGLSQTWVQDSCTEILTFNLRYISTSSGSNNSRSESPSSIVDSRRLRELDEVATDGMDAGAIP